MTTLREHATDPIMRELGANLTRLQYERGFSFRALDKALWRLLPDDSPSHETIRAYHLGIGTAARANLRVIAAICRVYGVTIASVSPELGRRATELRGLLEDEDMTRSG